MKKLVLSLSLAMTLGYFVSAQEAEIEKAVTAVNSNNLTAAKPELAKAKPLVNSNKSNLSPTVLADYYYAAGKVALADNNVDEAASNFSELAKYETGTAYTIKDKSTKKDFYFYDKAEAESKAASGDYSKVKEIPLNAKYSILVQGEISKLANDTNTKAFADYKADKYAEAGKEFAQVYSLLKALGQNNEEIKYYSAISYHYAKDYPKALVLYRELIKSGYKGSDAAKPIDKEIYANALRIFIADKKADPIAEEAAKKFSNDAEISELLASYYQVTGQGDKFTDSLKESVAKNPNDPTAAYNLGVVLMNDGTTNKDEAKLTEAKDLFKKAIALKPDYKNAYINLVSLIMSPEGEYVEQINANANGKTAENKKLYQEFSQKRKDMFAEAIPYLEKVIEIDPSETQIKSILENAKKVAAAK